MHDDPEATYRFTVYMAKVMGTVWGITLGCGLLLGAVFWAIQQLVRHLFGR